ncbi:hypothetical protein MHBO_000985 [Bonamia ostreae]|uniref:Uncharacterized protein n=1 Tax=Bonamia ostreae TaxID=126728 RepID=A0ABV2AHI0_9EUKA
MEMERANKESFLQEIRRFGEFAAGKLPLNNKSLSRRQISEEVRVVCQVSYGFVSVAFRVLFRRNEAANRLTALSNALFDVMMLEKRGIDFIWDPFCGRGTIMATAAEKMAHLDTKNTLEEPVPGTLKSLEDKRKVQINEKSEKKERKDAKIQFFGSDLNIKEAVDRWEQIDEANKVPTKTDFMFLDKDFSIASENVKAEIDKSQHKRCAIVTTFPNFGNGSRLLSSFERFLLKNVEFREVFVLTQNPKFCDSLLEWDVLFSAKVGDRNFSAYRLNRPLSAKIRLHKRNLKKSKSPTEKIGLKKQIADLKETEILIK